MPSRRVDEQLRDNKKAANPGGGIRGLEVPAAVVYVCSGIRGVGIAREKTLAEAALSADGLVLMAVGPFAPA
jgi:hypothetical protein